MANVVEISSRKTLRPGMLPADLLPGEDPVAYQQLLAAWTDEFQPVGVEETYLVGEIVRGIWLDHRYSRMESELLASGSDCDRIARRRQAARRQSDMARKELRRIQREDCAPEPGPVLGRRARIHQFPDIVDSLIS